MTTHEIFVYFWVLVDVGDPWPSWPLGPQTGGEWVTPGLSPPWIPSVTEFLRFNASDIAVIPASWQILGRNDGWLWGGPMSPEVWLNVRKEMVFVEVGSLLFMLSAALLQNLVKGSDHYFSAFLPYVHILKLQWSMVLP